MTAITTAAHIDAQTQEELMRQAGIWIEHSTLIEDDLPARPLAAVQAEKHQLDRYTQLVADRAAARGSKCLAQIEEPAQAVESQGVPVGEIVLFGGDLKEVSWAGGKMPPPGTKLYAAAAPAAAAPQGERQWICPTRTVADLVNNLLTLDQALPAYGAQYIEKDGRRCAIAVPPTVSRERVKDGRWIGQGEELNAAVIWTRAERPAAVVGPALDVTLDEDQAGLLRDMLGDPAEYEEALTVRLIVCDGHSGHGLYVAQAEYQDEGAALLAPLPATAAPALEAPAAPVDEHAAFESIFPIPHWCQRCGDGYVPTEFNAWDAQKHCERWEGWKARAALAAAPQAPAAPAVDALDSDRWRALEGQMDAGRVSLTVHHTEAEQWDGRTISDAGELQDYADSLAAQAKEGGDQ